MVREADLLNAAPMADILSAASVCAFARNPGRCHIPNGLGGLDVARSRSRDQAERSALVGPKPRQIGVEGGPALREEISVGRDWLDGNHFGADAQHQLERVLSEKPMPLTGFRGVPATPWKSRTSRMPRPSFLAQACVRMRATSFASTAARSILSPGAYR